MTRQRGLCGLCFAVVVTALTVGPARADDKALLQRLERLERQNELLMQRLEALTVPAEKKGQDDLKKQMDGYLKEKDEKKKRDDEARAREKEDEGFEVGKQLDVKGKWNNAQLWFETEDKAFRLHVGGRTQIDAVWVHAPANVRAPLADAGIGEFDDAVNFRRARLAVEGTLWEVFDFNCEYDFLNSFRTVPSGSVLASAVGGSQNLGTLAGTVGDRQNVVNTPVPTDLWIQWSKIPYVGNVRVGNQKPWISFEHLTSSRFLDFLERSTAFDAFVENGNNGFQPGVSVFNNLYDDRLFLGAGVYKTNFRDIYGYDVGDGEYQFTGRVAGTPLYEHQGRCLVHLGLGYLHAGADDGVIRFRGRTQLRNGPAILHNTVAIIQAQAHNYDLIVPEVAVNYGPFNLSGEYYHAQARMRPNEVFQNVNNQTGAALPRGGRGVLTYQGAYVTAGYFLTGESRSYNRKTMAWDRQAVLEPAFAVDGGRGLLVGRGAVEVLARYSWLDLASQGVNGGTVHAVTVGLNWFLNPNAKFQINYDLGYRDATQYSSVGTAGGVVRPGNDDVRDGIFQGVGTRLAFDF